MEIETKQRHGETNKSYEPNGSNIFREHFILKRNNIHVLLSTSRYLLKTDNIIGHKTELNRYKKIEIIPCTLSDHHGLRLIFNNNINYRNPTFTWKLKNIQ